MMEMQGVLTRKIAVLMCLAALVVFGSTSRAGDEGVGLGHVEVRGTGGIPMVLIPGVSSDWTVWEEFLDRHAGRFTMYAVTLAGMSGTPSPRVAIDAGSTPWLDHAVRSVARLIEDEGLERPIVMGHSMGGMIAMRLGIEHPELVGWVVTLDGMPAVPLGREYTPAEREDVVENRLAERLRRMNSEQWHREQESNLRRVIRDDEMVERLAAMTRKTHRRVGTQYSVEQIKSDIRPLLPRLETPTLAIAAMGPHSPEAMDFRGEWMQAMRRAPNAQLVFFEETNHFVMLDRPEELDWALREFLSGRRIQGHPMPTEREMREGGER